VDTLLDTAHGVNSQLTAPTCPAHRLLPPVRRVQVALGLAVDLLLMMFEVHMAVTDETAGQLHVYKRAVSGMSICLRSACSRSACSRCHHLLPLTARPCPHPYPLHERSA
jgi:hypothetical protein